MGPGYWGHGALNLITDPVALHADNRAGRLASDGLGAFPTTGGRILSPPLDSAIEIESRLQCTTYGSQQLSSASRHSRRLRLSHSLKGQQFVSDWIKRFQPAHRRAATRFASKR